MRAFHSNWTAPYFAANRSRTSYELEPFELFTTALSALSWQSCGGSIAMFCDSIAAQFYRKHDLHALWNDGVHTVLDDIPSDIDPTIFWAAGKLFALRAADTPCFMMDTDFIVWQDITALVGDAPLAVIHREDIAPEVYPNSTAFTATQNFQFHELNWSVQPSNTALAFFADDNFVREYTNAAIDFMKKSAGADNTLTYMVFAEQRLLSMFADKLQIPLLALSDLPSLFYSGQNYFTHVWGFKRQMLQTPKLYDDFCTRCATRLTKDYPDFAYIISKIPCTERYF